MNNIFKKITEEAKKNHLEKEEKMHIRKEIVAFMQKNPVRDERELRLLPWRLHNLFYFLTYRPMPVALFIVFIVSIGTSLAAESALPGDVLYSVKVNVNEEVGGLFSSFNNEFKADFEAKRADRRLQEAEKVAAKADLKGGVLVKIEENFQTHADRVKERIADFQARGHFNNAVDLSSKFESSLRAHEQVLVRLKADLQSKSSDTGEINSGLDSVIDDVHSVLKGVVELRASAEASAKQKAEEEKKSEVKKAEEEKHEDKREINGTGETREQEQGRLQIQGEAKGKLETKTDLDAAAEIRAKAKKNLNVDLGL